MNGNDGYAVFFFPQALEALGEAIKPYLTEGASGAHVLCREVDTAGSLVEMTLESRQADGKASQTELMVPGSMVRMIVSVHNEGGFGFAPRKVASLAPVPND